MLRAPVKLPPCSPRDAFVTSSGRLQQFSGCSKTSHIKHLQDVFNHVTVVEEVSNLGIQFQDFENLITDIYTMSYGFVMYKDHFLLQCKDPDMQSVS